MSWFPQRFPSPGNKSTRMRKQPPLHVLQTDRDSGVTAPVLAAASCPSNIAASWTPKIKKSSHSHATNPSAQKPQRDSSRTQKSSQDTRFSSPTQLPLFLQAKDQKRIPLFTDALEMKYGRDSSKVTRATIDVRRIATYKEVHKIGEKGSFIPWRPKDDTNPEGLDPLAYDFIKTFPSCGGKRREKLPDKEYFNRLATEYDPSVSVVEEALKDPGVRKKLSKFPPDVFSDGAGQLTSILKRSLQLEGAFDPKKERSVQRLPALDTNNLKTNQDVAHTTTTDGPKCSQTGAHSEQLGPLRVFSACPDVFTEEFAYGPRFEYIATTPDDADEVLCQKGHAYQPYGGFRVILEITLTPEVDEDGNRKHTSTKNVKSPEPITILLCTEVDATEMSDPSKWVELKAKGIDEEKWKQSERSNRGSSNVYAVRAWCQAVLTGSQRIVTLFHDKGEILDYKSYTVPTEENTEYLQNPKQHFGYLYNTLRGMDSIVKNPDEKFLIT